MCVYLLYLIHFIHFISHKVSFNDIIVFRDLEIENGVLGLERDIHLSLVKFLDSPIVRKVLVNTSV
jgi:hypothetical protein